MHSDQEGAQEAPVGRSALVEAAYAHLRMLGETVPLIELAGKAFRSNSVLPPSLLDELRGRLIVDGRFHGDDGSWGLVEWYRREQRWEDVGTNCMHIRFFY